MIKEIEIIKEIELDELNERLRRVQLKGFPEIQIYKDADISIQTFSPEQINETIFTPQPTIYRKGYLDRIDFLGEFFKKKGIDITKLNKGYDYIAIDNEGQATQWTLMPPVVEMATIYLTADKRLDYAPIISEELKQKIEAEGHSLNPQVQELQFDSYRNMPQGISQVPLICDGSHRIHSALEKQVDQTLLIINGTKAGIPYYAAPQPYDIVHVESERPEDGGKDKIHIITSPGHKNLYRLFPTGGIMSGSVRSWGGDGKKK